MSEEARIEEIRLAAQVVAENGRYNPDDQFNLADVQLLLKRVEELEQSDESKRLTLSKILWGEQYYSPVFPASWDNLYSALSERVDTPYPVQKLIAENERLKARVNRMLSAGMGKDWGDGFSDASGYET